jgi:hypothetical protein
MSKILSSSTNFYIQDQIGRIERTYSRLNGCDDVTKENYHLLRDAFIDFCVHCYHLKDVLIQVKVFDGKYVEDYITRSVPLSVCANVANKAKHLKLHKPQRESALPALMGEYLPINMAYNPFTAKSELHILYRPELKSALGSGENCQDFAKNCMSAWEKLLLLASR